ncbi:MAG: PBP1A family penicillin-binding protein [Candidatus Levybacteria bacterium]|nr:PBP1A family penicillin-binding protein [Candidatus Levybacteria bacterium]
MGKLQKIWEGLRKKRYFGLIIFTLAVLAGIFSYFFILKDLPSPIRLSSPNTIPQSSQVFDRGGKLLYAIYTNKNRTQVPLKQIPPYVQTSTIAIEDKDFYRHGAIDVRGITRAFIANITGKPIQGGSTLTQQLIKSSLLTPERSIQRKAKEIVLAFVTELLYSKSQILEMYLNQIPYGGTAYGIEAAAKTYFGKSAKDLTLAEAALLAGLPQSPTLYSPFGSRPELAKERQELVLTRMREQGYITADQEENAKKQKLEYKNISNSIEAPHFVLYIKDLLEKKYGDKFTEQGGFKITTTLDLDIQEFAELAVASEVAKLRFARVSNGAAVVTDPGNGDILALVGSKDYFDSEIDGNVNIALALRQPGSSIKPINYAVGLLNGYSAATVFIDKEICFPNQGGKAYCPRNYDGRFRGIVSMREALGSSLNIPAVKMLKLNTVETMIATAGAMGISTFKDPDRYGLSLTLGGGEVTMLDMAEAFGVFANKGYRVDLNPILEVKDSRGKVLEKKRDQSPIFGKKVLPEEVTFIISDILSDNQARSLAFGTNSVLVIPGQTVSVKTGTTNDYRDNWTIGYTPEYLVTTWVGNNDNSPMGAVVSGVTGASPIWNEIMSHLLEGKKTSPWAPPKNAVRLSVCKNSGLFPAEGATCETRSDYFIRNKFPKRKDPGKQNIWVDKTTQDLPKDPKQTENLELKEHYVVTDDVGDKYCVDCPHPEASPSPTPNP